MDNDRLHRVIEQFKSITTRIDSHIKYLDWLCGFLFFIAKFFLFSIPLLSSIITVLAATDKFTTGFLSPIFWLGAFLTIVSTVNVTIKPANQLESAALFFNKFKSIRCNIDKQINLSEDPNQLLEFLDEVTIETETLINDYNKWLSGFLAQSGKLPKN